MRIEILNRFFRKAGTGENKAGWCWNFRRWIDLWGELHDYGCPISDGSRVCETCSYHEDRKMTTYYKEIMWRSIEEIS